MAEMFNAIALSADQVCYAVLEDARGVLKAPTDPNEMIAVAGSVDVSQAPSYSESDENTNSRDKLSRFKNQAAAGQWAIPIYARPSGSLGVLPMAHVLYRSLFGIETVKPNISVEYTQAMEKESFSLWVKKGHTVFFASGAVAEKLDFEVTNTGGVKHSLSGGFMKMGWVGRGKILGTVSQSSFRVDDAKKFCVGGLCWNKTTGDNNANKGFKITDVNYSTKTIITETAVGWSDGDIIEGFLPTGSTAVGSPMHQKNSSVKVNNTAVKVQSASISIDDGVQYTDDEVTVEEFPTDYMESKRNITGSVNMYFRADDAKYFYDGFNDEQFPVSITCGATAGSRMTLTLPKSELSVPKPSDNAPAINLSMELEAFGTTGEDSCSLLFT